MKSVLLFVLSVLSVVRSVDRGYLYVNQDGKNYFACDFIRDPQSPILFVRADRITLSDCHRATLEAVNDTGTKKRIVISEIVKIKLRYGRRDITLGAGDGRLKFFRPKREGWSSVNIGSKEGRIHVTYRKTPVAGRLEEYDRKDNIPRYTFKYPVPKTDSSIVILYFKPCSKESNLPPPMTTPEGPPPAPVSTDLRLGLSVGHSNQANPIDSSQTGRPDGQQLPTSPVPSNLPVSTEQWLALSLGNSNQANPIDLWQTSRANDQQLPTSTLRQGPHWDAQNPGIQPGSAGPHWDGRNPKISDGLRSQWDAQNEYIKHSIEDLKHRYGQNSDNSPSTESNRYQ